MQLQQVVVFYVEYIISLLIPASNNLSPLQFYGITDVIYDSARSRQVRG